MDFKASNLEISSVLNYLPKDKREEISALFGEAASQQAVRDKSKSVLESMEIIEAQKGKSFIVAGSPCRCVYIMLQGRARGIEVHLEEKIYIFRSFAPGQILGELETYAGFPSYLATIQAVQKCVLAKIPSALWLAWMKRDVKALFLRTQTLVSELINQVKAARNYLFMNCYDRMVLFLINLYAEQLELNGSSVIQVKKTRPELADLLGFSVKTVNRTVAQFQKDGLLDLNHGKITISPEQFEAISDYCDEHFLTAQYL